MLSTVERLAKARELVTVGAFISAAPGFRREFLLKRRADGLREVLLGRKSNTVTDLDLFNPSDSAKLIAEHLDSLSDEPLETQGRAASYLSIVAEHVDLTHRSANGPVMGGSHFEMPDLLRRLASLREYARTPGYREATYLAMRDAGGEAHVARFKAMTAQRDLDSANEKSREAYAPRLAIYEAEVERRVEQIQPLKTAYYEADTAIYAHREALMWGNALTEVDADEVARRVAEEERLMAVKAAALAAYNAKHKELFEDFDLADVPDEFRPLKEAAQEALKAAGQAITDAALAASPVSEKDAAAWAAAQEINASGRAKLKKLGYDPKQVRKDMAEFYRLTGGRLAAIKIRSSRAKRASAGEIHGPKTSVINLGSFFDKRVLFHELGHHIEADPVALAAARGFLEARRESSKTSTMNELTGGNGYEKGELAFKGPWFDAYVGKDYMHNGQPYATEVFSMGLESFSDPAMLARRLSVDPHHFALVLGFMKTPPDPLYSSVKKVFKQLSDAESDAEDEADVIRADGIKRLAAAVEFVKLDPEPPVPYNFDWPGTEYLGSYGLIDAWQIKAKNLPTGNYSRTRRSGIALTKYEAADDRRYRDAWSNRYVFDGMEAAKAMARVWANSVGNVDLAKPDEVKQWADRIEAQAASQP